MSRLLTLLTAAAAVAALMAPSARAVVTRHVATTGTDTGNCISSPCKTLQYAINQSLPTDTIQVAAGMYPVSGLVSVNKTLTLQGANAGVDARGARGAESILQNSQGMSVSARDVVIDGFTVENSTVAAYTGYGIWLNPGVSGTQIVNNIIQDNIVGIGLANAGPTPALIQHNLIRDNNRAGGAGGTGIYTDQFVGGVVTGVLIDANDFVNNKNAGVGFSSTKTSSPDSDVEISDNSFDRNGRGIYFFNTNSVRVHDNSITNSTTPTDGGTSVAIAAFGSVNGLTILNNDLLTGTKRGIRVVVGDCSPDGTCIANSNVEAHLNNIVGFAYAGLEVDSGGHDGPVNATCNWWGSASGPTNPDNPGGTGDKVIGDAIFRPWLIARAPTGPCLGVTESTPGKVTGGGQVLGDPVFSSLGVLLSVPAVIPSLADPKAQASFGFVAQCCAARGNLEYNDKPADVRIKAQAIEDLFIVDGPCGPRTQAFFTGTADVIRSTGTTSESFVVEVEDCNEPGSSPGTGPDTFGIFTDSYANGPTPLIGGNIQIHKG